MRHVTTKMRCYRLYPRPPNVRLRDPLIYSALLTWSHPVRLTSWDVYSWRINYALPAHTVELTVGAYHLGISSETLFT
jgi:hypothetical protein